MKSSLEMALRPISFNLQVRNIHVLHHLINEYSPKRDICWDICLHRMLKSSLWFPRVQWQIFQIQQLCIHTQCSVILVCHWRYKLFVHWWMKGIYFASFYFRVWDLTREIRKNKNPAKISTHTVFKSCAWCKKGVPKGMDLRVRAVFHKTVGVSHVYRNFKLVTNVGLP